MKPSVKETNPKAPRNERELLEFEEMLARRRLLGAARALGEDIASATRLREGVRNHPFVTTATGFLGGLFLAPIGPRQLRHVTRLAGRFAGMSVVGETIRSWLLQMRNSKPFRGF